jgi:hypothetical protein
MWETSLLFKYALENFRSGKLYEPSGALATLVDSEMREKRNCLCDYDAVKKLFSETRKFFAAIQYDSTFRGA